MANLLSNFRNTVIVSTVLALILLWVFAGQAALDGHSTAGVLMRWLHVFFGILWIGLLYYFNFVQIRIMPKIPAELKGGVSGHIAPEALFWFRWAALFTVITGLLLGAMNGWLVSALMLGLDSSPASPANMLIGIGMWLGLIMAFNVWFIIWPNQQKALNIGNAYPDLSAEAKAAAGKTAMLFSRTNMLLSLPMLVAMAGRQTMFG